MMKTVFIDANVYCGFYEGNTERSAVLEKLLKFMTDEKINLIVTEQVRNEFYKNRSRAASKIVRQIDVFKQAIGSSSLPACVADIEEFKEFETERKKLKELCDKIRKKFIDYVLDEKSKINKLIADILNAANYVEIDDSIIGKAERRVFKGMPPGKDHGNNGDEINWEALLTIQSDDLYVVAYDIDWCEQLRDGEIHNFLAQEWKKLKKGKLQLRKNLTAFINEIAEGSKPFNDEVVKSEDEVRRSFQSIASSDIPLYFGQKGYSGYSPSGNFLKLEPIRYQPLPDINTLFSPSASALGGVNICEKCGDVYLPTQIHECKK